MQFLSDLYVRCAECEGKRFQPHVLKVQLHGKSIHDVLELTVSEAIQFLRRSARRKALGDPLSNVYSTKSGSVICGWVSR
jgi:excinuclease ABC subunit A